MRFQSPRNRVKCSDGSVAVIKDAGAEGFNPLEIGSNVLIRLGDRRAWFPALSFNPLAIGSNVLIFDIHLAQWMDREVSIP